MTAVPKTIVRRLHGALSLLVVATLYEAVARSGLFPPVLLPTLPVVARTLYASCADGTLPMHALYTL